VVRNYVRPTYPDISSCQRGFAAGSLATAAAVPYSTTCVYKNGVTVAFAKGDNAEQIGLFRGTIFDYLRPAGTRKTEHLGARERRRIQQELGQHQRGVLDDNRWTLYAFASSTDGSMSISKLRDWWRQEFGQS